MSHTPTTPRQVLLIAISVLVLVAMGSIWKLNGDGTKGQTGRNGTDIQAGDQDALESGCGTHWDRSGKVVTNSAGVNVVQCNWSTSPSDDLRVAGAHTIRLQSCPAGVKGSEAEYWIWLDGGGASEAVKVTGGTCAGDGTPGTLKFMTSAGHAAGYSISSATSGLQEASIAARFTPTNPTGTAQGGKVVVPPGTELKLYARASLRSSDQTIDFTGSIFECYMKDTCLFLGDPASSTAAAGIVLLNPRGRPMVAGGTYPMIEVNAQGTKIFNVRGRVAPKGNSFGTWVQVDDDQSFLLDGLVAGFGYGVRCDAEFCGSYVSAPGPFNKWSAVGWLKNMDVSAQCVGNGVDWQSGNTLHVSDSIIQGYPQYGLRGGLRRGGYGNIKMTNVYMEVGGCTNPTGNIGIAGVLAQGGPISIEGGEGPQGAFPTYARTGSVDYRYYVVARHSSYGFSNPLYVGSALSSGKGAISVTTPDIPGAVSFDLLRVTAPSGVEQAPYGVGAYAVAEGAARSAVCKNGVCTFTDENVPLRSYKVAPNPTYFPLLTFWPGPIVLGSGGDSQSLLTAARLDIDDAPSTVVSELGTLMPAVVADNCSLGGTHWTPTWISCTSTPHPWAGLPIPIGGLQNRKGKLILMGPGAAPGHILTLVDSDPQKTIANALQRPPSDVTDSYIGFDAGDGNPAHVGISLGAPVSLSNYIGNTGDGKGWKERLTVKDKTFAVPVVIEPGNTLTLGSGSALSQIGVFKARIEAAKVAAQSCVDVAAAVKGVDKADVITGLTPPAALGNLSLSAYPGSAGNVSLHFCNASQVAAIAPGGVYSFVTVR
jgi:hypothetical protein